MDDELQWIGVIVLVAIVVAIILGVIAANNEDTSTPTPTSQPTSLPVKTGTLVNAKGKKISGTIEMNSKLILVFDDSSKMTITPENGVINTTYDAPATQPTTQESR